MLKVHVFDFLLPLPSFVPDFLNGPTQASFSLFSTVIRSQGFKLKIDIAYIPTWVL